MAKFAATPDTSPAPEKTEEEKVPPRRSKRKQTIDEEENSNEQSLEVRKPERLPRAEGYKKATELDVAIFNSKRDRMP